MSEAFNASHVEVLFDRNEEWNLRMEMVRRAERFLILTTYYFGSDERSGEMACALTEAAKRGVRVVLVVDRFGHRLSQNLSLPEDRPKLLGRLQDLTDAGATVLYYTPKSLRHRVLGGGLHVKIQVSEAGAAIFGSSNIAHQSFSHWNEVSLLLCGEVVSRLLQDACVFSGLDEADTNHLLGLLPVVQSTEANATLRYLCEDPAERSGPLFPFGRLDNRLTDELVRLIDSAEHSLCVASLYCKPAPELKRAILRACRRGVDVEIFHSHRDSLGVTHMPWISASIQYSSILKAGGRIYENRSGEHSKVIFVDNRHVAVGSYNLEHAAHDRLIEAMIFTSEEAICERFVTLFETLRKAPGNLALTPGWLSELPLQLQVKRWLYRPMQRWM